MREIKFRGKTKVNGWVYGFLCHDWEIKGPGGGIHIVNKNTVGQYTGLKDENGKEIYEGDILKSDSGYRLIVKFGNHGYSAYTDCVELGFYCECVSEQAKRQQIREDFLFWVREEQSKIIGNIHENPELLEVQG